MTLAVVFPEIVLGAECAMVGAPPGNFHLGAGSGRLGLKPVVMVAMLRNQPAFPHQRRKSLHVRRVRAATRRADVALLLVTDRRDAVPVPALTVREQRQNFFAFSKDDGISAQFIQRRIRRGGSMRPHNYKRARPGPD